MTCEHEQFKATVEVGRLSATEGGPVTHYVAEIAVVCASCGEPFEFQGLPVGYSAYQPTVDLGGAKLNAPLMPPGEKPPEGLPSFGVRMITETQ